MKVLMLLACCGLMPPGHAEVDTFALCKPLGYPKGSTDTAFKDCYKVGSFSHIAEIFPHSKAQPSDKPLRFEKDVGDTLSDFQYYDLKDPKQTQGLQFLAALFYIRRTINDRHNVPVGAMR